MNVVALHKKSLSVYNIISVDSITVSGEYIVIHGISAGAGGSATNYSFLSADYLISIVSN